MSRISQEEQTGAKSARSNKQEQEQSGRKKHVQDQPGVTNRGRTSQEEKQAKTAQTLAYSEN